MKFQQTNSGIIVPMETPKPPPEHPARRVIRDCLRTIQEELAGFEQTSHGRLGGGSIGEVAKALADAYEKPAAFSISELSQAIDTFLKESDVRA